MTPDTLILYSLGLFVIVLISSLIFIFWKDLYGFFKPTYFHKIFLIANDNSIREIFYYKKNPNDQWFTFKGSKYFFSTKPKDTYQRGRYKSYFYKINNAYPINLLDTSTIDSRLLEEFSKISIADMFKEPQTALGNFIEKYGLYVLIIIGIIIFISMSSGGG